MYLLGVCVGGILGLGSFKTIIKKESRTIYENDV